MRVMTITKTIKMNQVTPGTVISGELNKSSKSNSPIIITPVFTIARPGAPNEGTVFCVRESKVPVKVAGFFCLHQNTKKDLIGAGRVNFVWFQLMLSGFSNVTGASPGHYRHIASVLSQKLSVKRCPSFYLSLGAFHGRYRLGGIH